jgi:TolB-like protein
MKPDAAGKVIGEKRFLGKLSRKMALAAIIVLVIVAGGLIGWNIYLQQSKKVAPASVEKMAYPLPEKPSIAVLPFVNMSEDHKQEYFSDGLTDELIADLAKIKDILVISRNSAFTYKGKTVKVQQIAQELNVRYILEGSVQRSGNKVRIRAQLIDGKTDHHLWSESYDGVMDDIFDLQDKITHKIVSALSVTLTSDERDRITDKGTDSIPAYEAYLKGLEHYSRMTGDNLLKAIKYYREAVKIDPEFSRAYSGLATAYFMCASFNFPGQSKYQIVWDIMNFKIKARHYLNLAMKNPRWEAYVVAAYMDIARKRFDEAVSSAEKALLMAPNEYLANIAVGHVLNCVGRADEALKYLDMAMRLDPRFLDILLVEKGKAFFLLGDFEKAVAFIQEGLTLNPALTNYSSFKAASHAFLGNMKEAKDAWHKFVDGFPTQEHLSTKYLYYFFPFKDHKVFDRFIDGLNTAGFEGNPSDYYRVDKKNRLSGQKIKELLFGKIAKGYDAIEREFSYRWTAVGDFEFSCPQALILEKGKSRIEGDSICHQFEYLYDGIKACMDVYYITERNDDAKKQYLYIGDSWLTTISIKE